MPRSKAQLIVGLLLALAGVLCARVPTVLAALCSAEIALHAGRITALIGLIAIMLGMRARAMERARMEDPPAHGASEPDIL
jgi:hypothetical protein